MTQDLTTLICLFHTRSNAHAALEDILKAGVPEPNVTLVGDEGSTIASNQATLAELNLPQRDRDHFLDAIAHGGAVLTVSALSDHAATVESIFKEYSADKIDEATIADDMSAAALPPQDLVVAEDVFIVADPRGGLDEVHVLTPVEPSADFPLDSVDENGNPDTDPRDLGLDPRMKPRE